MAKKVEKFDSYDKSSDDSDHTESMEEIFREASLIELKDFGTENNNDGAGNASSANSKELCEDIVREENIIKDSPSKKDKIVSEDVPSGCGGLSEKISDIKRPDAKGETRKQDRFNKGLKTATIGTSKTVSQERLRVRSDNLKILLSFILGTLLATFINHYEIVDFGKLIGFSSLLKKESIHTDERKKLPYKTDKAEAKTAFLKMVMNNSTEKPEVLRKEFAHQDTPEVGREPNQVIIVNQEVHEGLPQTDEAISETNPIVIEDPIRPAMPLQAMEGADKSVPNLGEMALSYPYSVYLGSFLTFKRVQNADSIYRKMGLPPYWVKVDLGEKGVWFRVFTGYFKKKEAAEAFIKENQIAEASSKRTKYATLIGTYTSEEKLEMNRLALLELGYCPYIIGGVNPESKLYIGAFYTKAGAEKQYADLASKGIQSQVVRR